MEQGEIAIGLDIGTTKIVTIVGRKNEFDKIEILGFGKAKSLGVQRGVVSNITQTIDSIKHAIADAEADSGATIDNCVVGIAGQHIRSLQHSDYILRENAQEVITQADVDLLVQNVHKLVMLPGEEIIHVLPQEFKIDGDWSAAAPLLVLGALCATPDLEVQGIRGDFTQADSGIKGALLFAGYHILGTDDGLSIKKKRPRAFNLDLSNSPDLFPVLAALASFSNKPSRLSGANRLVGKESDRASVLISEFAKAGITIERDNDELIIHPGKTKPCRIDPHGDHRIVMAAAILGCAGSAEIEIINAECVAKSYPTFFDDLESIGGIVDKVQ